MIIDITKLNQNIEDVIYIDEELDIRNDEISDDEIKGLKNVKVSGNITINEERDVELNLDLSGTMILLDSISLDPIDYQFSCKIDEIYEKNDINLPNTIDIFDILWQNIVLEIPLKFTKVDDYSEFKGDGWKLLSEDDVKSSNNPFEDLKDMFGEE